MTTVPDTIHLQLPDLRVGALTWGPADGPLALLVHGFPDTAWSWRKVGPALADRGWRVVAPFSRGYAPSELAADGCYQPGALASDIVELHRALGGDARALLVGHDWGAIATWGVSVHSPDLFAHIVAMSVPPQPTLRRAFTTPSRAGTALRQAGHSWYVLANLLPWISVASFRRLVAALWRRWSPGLVADEDLAHVFEALSTDERRRAAVAYYRALLLPWRRRPQYRDFERACRQSPVRPTLYLHGEKDGCMLAGIAATASQDLPDGRVVIVPGGGHFLQLDSAPAVISAIIAATEPLGG